MKRLLGATMVTLLLTAGSASAGPLGLDDCRETQGVYECSGTVKSWDGVPLDTTVVLPASHARKRALVAEIHGFGNSKYEYLDPESTAYTDNAYAWAREGYAVLAYSARGLWGSCGTPESRAADPLGCARGYVHLADARYEVRDTQALIGRLVDDGYVAKKRIGVTGDSYGGGQSLMLAALRDRMMLPGGRLVRWHSPDGTPLSIAAAAPVIPWSDLVTAAAPNGKVTANGITDRRTATNPVGVVKTKFITGISLAARLALGPGQPIGEPFVFGRPMGFVAPADADPDADIASLIARTDQGEPYSDPESRSIVSDLVRFHSAYYIDPGSKPPPLFLASGFTDDLFPVDEVLRYANRTRKLYPRSPVSIRLGDFGHQRASNDPVERKRLLQGIHRWFDHYLRDAKRKPARGVTAYIQTCPKERESIGPFRAATFAKLSHRRLTSTFKKPRSITSDGGDPAVGNALDPLGGGGDGCIETPWATATGTARYKLQKVGKRSVSLLGAPKLSARLKVTGVAPGVAQLASRLWDVAPDGESQRLIARGLSRPADGKNTWELHPAAWRAQAGHTIELELLGNDAPTSRPANGDYEVTVSDLRVVLPAR
ncbi:MAG: acetylxylan esterase [Thermoleophilia bacterium]|nr:acetylxylan esterase [Thermoleophilia bacterium]